MRRLAAFGAFAAFVVGIVATVATVAGAAPLAIADAFWPRNTGSVSLAPDGAHLLTTVFSKSAAAVVLLDAESLEAKTLYGSTSIYGAPLSFRWIGPELVAVQTYTGVVTLSLDGTVQRSINGTLLAAVPGDRPGHERMVVVYGGYYRKVGARSTDSDSVSIDVPNHTRSLIFDDHGVARVAISRRSAVWSDDTTVTYWYRGSEADDWRSLAEFPVLDIAWAPVAVAKDDRSLVVASRDGRDTYAVFRYDLATRRMTDVLAAHPREDITGIEDDDDRSFSWVRTKGLKPTIHWFDPAGAALQRDVDTALPDRVNVVVRRAGDRALILSYGDVDPGAWYLLQITKGELRKIVTLNPHVTPAAMRPVQTVSYRTEDGFDIPAYLTLPEGGGKNLPAIVLVHGGPVARDEWGFDPEVQLLVSRGYAVLQPQFRGSTGFGKRFEEAGLNQWGLAMQDDVTAGARWLISEGIADPARICIYGASYGGYAAMWAMVKTPTLFRCGVSLAGVSDLNDLFTGASDTNRNPVARLLQRAKIGDPEKMHDAFDAVSPAKHAADFQVPVLIAHGDHDTRVPVSNSRALAAALRAHHKSVEWLELPGEGHSLNKAENQERFFNTLFEFLNRNIGTVAAPDK